MMTTRLLSRCRLLLSAACLLALAGCSHQNDQAKRIKRASDYIAANQRTSAEIELLNVLRAEPQNIEATKLLAQVYLDQGRLAQALPLLVSASRLQPSDASTHLKLGQGWLAANRPAEAFTEALATLAARPDDSDGWMLLAEAASTPEQLTAAHQHLTAPANPSTLDATRLTALAILDMRDNDFASATARLDAAIAKDPQASATYAVKATISLAQGDRDAAAAAFAKVAATAPARSARSILAARYLLRTNGTDAARKLLDATIAAAPDYLPALTLRAELALADKDNATCDSLLTKIRGIDSNYSDAQVLQARAKLQRGEFEAAEQDLQKLVTTFPHSGQLYYMLALAQLGGPNQANAPRSLTRAIDLAPDNADAILLLATINIRRDNAGAAVLDLQALTKKQPGLQTAWSLLAEAYQRQGNLSAALETLTTAEKQFPDKPELLLRKAVVLRGLGRDADARTTLEAALTAQPDFFQAVEQLIDLDLQAKQTDAARDRALAFAKAFPDQPEAQLLIARVALAREDVPEAESALRTVIKLRPDSGQAYLLLARLLIQNHRADDALRELAEAADRDPKALGVRMLIGMIRQQRGEIDAARTAYEQALAIKPDFIQGLNNLAYIYSEHDHDLDRAQTMAERARKLSPHDPYVLDTLGWILFQKGQYNWARSLFVESASKLANIAEVQAHLGLTYYMLGEMPAAAKALQTYLQLEPAGELAGEVRQCIALLESDPQAPSPELPGLAAARLKTHADDPVAALRLAAWQEAHGKAKEANDTLIQALKQQPKNVRLLVARADWIGRHGDVAEAYQMARKTYQDATDDLGAAQSLGRLAFRVGEHESAANILRECARKSPTDAGLQRDLAAALAGVGDLTGARTAWQAAIAAGLAGDDAASARRNIGLLAVAIAGKRGPAAPADVNELIASAPTSPEARLAQATLQERAGDAAGAAAIYEAVLKSLPSCHAAALNLAAIYADMPDHRDRAVELATRERASQPDNPRTSRILGILAYHSEEWNRAVPLLTEAMLKFPDDSRVCWMLGNALAKLQREDEARTAWQRALDRGLTGSAADDVRRRLASTTPPS